MGGGMMRVLNSRAEVPAGVTYLDVIGAGHNLVPAALTPALDGFLDRVCTS